MVCDDSAVIRGLITRGLEEDPQIQVVTTVPNGQMAVSALSRFDIEVCILDIEMPVMDGLTALPKMIEAQPDLQVVMASTLTRRNAEISMRALSAGAADYLAKPTTSMALNAAAEFKAELAQKVKALGAARRRAVGGSYRPPVAPAASASPSPRAFTAAAQTQALANSGTATPSPAVPARPAFRPLTPLPMAAKTIALRPATNEMPDILAIGSSTGGPQALFKVLGSLGKGITQPIVITQHMPATFTTILAEHIQRASGMPACEGADGMVLQGGHIYVAPGDFHMTVEVQGGQKLIRLNKNPPENYCRPSVDPMLRSLVKIYGRKILTTILTGMGQDGMKGGEAVVAAGGTVIAQDERTSVVWGMPGAVATAGLCSAVLPLEEIAPYLRRIVTRTAA